MSIPGHHTYFWTSPLETELWHSNQLPIIISCIRIQPKFWTPVSFLFVFFSKQHLWPGQRCHRHKGPVSSLLSHINSWYDIYPWRHSNLKWWRLSHILLGPQGGRTGINCGVCNVVKIIIGIHSWVDIFFSQGHISLNKTSQLLERQGNHRICSK